MEKERYENAEMEVIRFEEEDVITTSTIGPQSTDPYELPVIKDRM